MATPAGSPDPGAFGRQVRAAHKAGITAVQNQGESVAAVHLVHPASQGAGSKPVDDGAHGTHDYGVALHPEVVSRFKAHGARLDDHDARISRLEGAEKLDRGSPEHQKGGT